MKTAILVVIALTIIETIISFIRKRMPSEYEISRKQTFKDSVRKAKENIAEQEHAAKSISDAYINPIIAKIRDVMDKYNASGFVEVAVEREYVSVAVFDAFSYPKGERISLHELKYRPLDYEETVAVAGAIKYRFGKDYVWERITGTDDYDGSTFHDWYTNKVKHSNVERLKTGGIKPF